MMLHNSCLICTSSSLPVLHIISIYLSIIYERSALCSVIVGALPLAGLCLFSTITGVLLHTQHNSYLGTMLSYLYTSHVRLCLKFNTSMLFLFSLVAYLPSISCQGISTFHSWKRYFSMLSKSSSKSTTVPTPPGIVKGTLEKLKLSI